MRTHGFGGLMAGVLFACASPSPEPQGPAAAPPADAATVDAPTVDAAPADAAVDAPNADAAWTAGHDPRFRRPPPTTPEEIEDHLRHACMLADIFACLGLAQDLARGSTAQRAEAEGLFRLVCSEADICVPLALHLIGNDTRASRREGRAILARACKAGERDACEQRRRIKR